MLAFKREIYKYTDTGRAYKENPTCQDGIDIAFCIDYTGSMSHVFETLKTNIVDFIKEVNRITGGENYRIGISIFDQQINFGNTLQSANSEIEKYIEADNKKYFSKNFEYDYYYSGFEPNDPDIDPSAVPKHINVFGAIHSLNDVKTDYTDSKLINRINLLNKGENKAEGLPLGDGGNNPEPSDIILNKVINENFLSPFDNNHAKYVVLITDTYPSGRDDEYSTFIEPFTLQKVAKSMVDKKIQPILILVNTQSDVDNIYMNSLKEANPVLKKVKTDENWVNALLEILQTDCGKLGDTNRTLSYNRIISNASEITSAVHSKVNYYEVEPNSLVLTLNSAGYITNFKGTISSNVFYNSNTTETINASFDIIHPATNEDKTLCNILYPFLNPYSFKVKINGVETPNVIKGYSKDNDTGKISINLSYSATGNSQTIVLEKI